MIVRALDQDADLERYLEVVRQSEPVAGTAGAWRERERRVAPGGFRHFLVGELDGAIVAIAVMLDHDLLPNGVAARVAVDTAHRGRGLGRAMAAALDDLLAVRRPAVIEARVRDDDPASRAWAERRGFQLQRRMIRSRLDLAGFDVASHRPAVERAEREGFTFETTEDIDRLYELFVRLVPDTPDGLVASSRDSFGREVEERPGLVRLIVREGPTWAGMAVQEPRDEGAWNAFTGVLPAFRGRGLATVLKVLAIEEAVRQGRTHVETTNGELNGPMLAVNRALGYVPVSGTIYLRRTG